MSTVPDYLDNVAHLRVPPHSVPAEQSVLGALLLVGESLAQVRDQLAPEDFYRRENQLIYQGICGVADLKREVDVVTVGDWITANVEIGAQELVATVYDLAGSTPSAANVRAYAEIVRNKALLRQLIETTTDIADSAYGASDDEAEEVVSASATKLASLTVKSSGSGGLVMVRSGVQKAWDEMEARYHGEGTQGLVPKWSSVRRKIPYLEPTDLVVLAARPSMGKTALALNWAEDAAAGGTHVAAFSLEMSASQWSLRLMAAHAGVDLSRMREKGALDNDEWARLSLARNYIQSLRRSVRRRPGSTCIPHARQGAGRPGPDRGGLPPAADGAGQGREPHSGGFLHFPEAQRAGQGSEVPGHRPVPAQPKPGGSHGQAPGHGRPPRVRCHRAGRRRDRLPVPRRLLQQRRLWCPGHLRTDRGEEPPGRDRHLLPAAPAAVQLLR